MVSFLFLNLRFGFFPMKNLSFEDEEKFILQTNNNDEDEDEDGDEDGDGDGDGDDTKLDLIRCFRESQGKIFFYLSFSK